MNIDKMVEIGLLFEQYKELLTDKQKEIVSLYYEENYSLGEISENLNVSRQGVYDTLCCFCKINIVRIDHCILQIMPIIIEIGRASCRERVCKQV